MHGITHCFPEVGIGDLGKALDYYTEVMGFELSWRAGDEIAVIRDGSVSMFLRSRKSGGLGPSRTILNVNNADRVFTTWQAVGVAIIEPIATRPWGMREFVAADPDGNEFRVGHVDESEADYDDVVS
ncbi:MAG: hypothetical protein GY947_20230 [Rhodobacteraceae bacterium]|nr:hypothetical protein [Paracoccaceae bacterium]